MAFLEVNDLVKDFGGVVANNHVSFQIEQGEIIGLIGPNGAGKSTLFNCIVGYHRPDSGKVIFKGKEITGAKPFMTNREGIGRTFQLTKVTTGMTRPRKRDGRRLLQNRSTFHCPKGGL